MQLYLAASTHVRARLGAVPSLGVGDLVGPSSVCMPLAETPCADKTCRLLKTLCMGSCSYKLQLCPIPGTSVPTTTHLGNEGCSPGALYLFQKSIILAQLYIH